ncbi:cysteine synthase A [Candidatus Izimaplasma sp. ZiA1]|uniref:cysteine synthase A n=1 Tax=Candidatus Izimoplasma sp. ZiA1 TaxID=2024899 RepID=UPI00196ABE25
MMIYQNIYQTIGNTPVVKLNKLANSEMADVYVKLEWFNPGGSVKDRIAINMIEKAEESGLLKPGMSIVEPTSGNTGIGLALVASAKGYPIILTMPESLSVERRKILTGYGAKLILTPSDKGMKGSILEAEKIAKDSNYFMPMQFKNLNNPLAHMETTSQEILNDFSNIDAFVAGVGTGGTITGVGTILKKHIPGIQVHAVEPQSSAVLSGENPGPHKIQGIGAGFIPDILDTSIYDSVIKVTDDQAFNTARLLAKEEGLFTGISTGANVYAAVELAKKLGKGKVVLTVSPSNGERYLSTTLYE